MGRIGAGRARWQAWSRRRRIAVAGVAAFAGLAVVGALTGSGSGRPGTATWHDALAAPTTASPGTAPPNTASPTTGAATGATGRPGDGPGSGTDAATGSPSTAAPTPAVPPTTGTGSTTIPANGPTRTTGGPSPKTTTDLRAGLRVAAEGPRTGYDRTLFGDWTDADHDHCNTREDILEAQSSVPVTMSRTATCTVLAGDWVSSYDGRTLTDPAQVQIDHMVPLAEAWDSGAASWDSTRREQFANDVAHPELRAVSAASNDSKGDSDPAGWMPPVQSSWCGYATDWITVKVAWGLTADPAEVAALQRMLATCPGGAPVPAQPPPTPATGPAATTSTTAPPTTTTQTPVAGGTVVLAGLDCAGEGVTVHNSGTGSAALTGWTIHDDGGKHTFTFPSGTTLPAGASVTVRSGGTAGPGELQWLKAPVWNNDGDTATLVDPGGTARSAISC